MKDWVSIANALVNLTTALILLKKAKMETKEKGTKRRGPRKRK